MHAPAHHLFEIVSDPNGHVAIDGSGMLISAPDASVVTGVGDRFLVNMDREPLGDVPMGKYQVENVVVVFEPDVPVGMLTKTLENLDRIASSEPDGITASKSTIEQTRCDP